MRSRLDCTTQQNLALVVGGGDTEVTLSGLFLDPVVAYSSLSPTVGSLQPTRATELLAHLGQGRGRAAAEPEAALHGLQAEAGGSPGRGVEARLRHRALSARKAQLWDT